ncbi:MAG: flagellar basal body P-ring protein FlgI [Planctomycetota bacterium]
MCPHPLLILLLSASVLLGSARRLRAQLPKIRLGEIISVEGARANKLSGAGIVTGLKGTGDGTQAARQALISFLARMNVKVRVDQVASGNIALVHLEAVLPPFSRHGDRLNVTVSSIGEATSLRGGTLLQAELVGPDLRVYALADGPLITGGFQARGSTAKVTRNHPTVGYIPGGAICEPPVTGILPDLINESGELSLLVSGIKGAAKPSYSSLLRATKAINELLSTRGIGVARAGKGNVSLLLDPAYHDIDSLTHLLAEIESLEIVPDPVSTVIVNEKTGTIIIGRDVRIHQCIVQVTGLTIQVIDEEEVSQPGPGISLGTTEKVTRTRIDVTSQGAQPQPIGGGGSLNDLVQGLQSLGVDSHSMIAVLKELNDANYLHARLEVR